MEFKNNSVKECLANIIEESTIHGLPRIVKTKSWLIKIIWTLCFLGSTSYCVYLVYKSIIGFLQYDVITCFKTVKEQPAVFPVITLCNYNQYQNRDTFQLVSSIDSQLSGISNSERDFFIRNQIYSFNDSFKKSLSYDFSELLINCRLNNKNCTADEFSWIYHPLYGSCFQYNTGKSKTGHSTKIQMVNRPGSNNGLIVELFIGNLNDSLYFIEKTGFHVMITNQTYKIGIDEGYDISPGVHTSIGLNRNVNKKLPEPYNECVEDISTIKNQNVDIYNAFVNKNITYREIDCKNLCFQKLVIENCFCYVNSLDKLNGNSPCLSPIQISCSLNVWYDFLTTRADECKNLCPEECESMNFLVTTTFAEFPSVKYAETLMSNPKITSKLPNFSLNYDRIKQSVLGLSIFYDQLSYTEISQQPKMEIVDLVSNFGGLLGLFLGFSFLSFIEFVEAFLSVILILVSKKNSNKVNQFKS